MFTYAGPKEFVTAPEEKNGINSALSEVCVNSYGDKANAYLNSFLIYSKAQIENIEYQGTQTSVLSKKSFYTVLSYGYSSRVVSKALRGELNLGNDVMTGVILGLLLNNQLDDTNKSK